MSLLERVHGGYVHTRRVRVLVSHLAQLFPAGARVLDVGCGDGLLARSLVDHRPDLSIQGIDVFVRDATHIDVQPFDGQTIPHGDGTFDSVLFVDVLHHTDDPMILLREANRVSRRDIVIKDHLLEGLLAGTTLRFMDHVGNARHGVSLPYNYWPRQRWDDAFATLGWNIETWIPRLKLYPWPARLIFERNLHYLAHLVKVPKRQERDPRE